MENNMEDKRRGGGVESRGCGLLQSCLLWLGFGDLEALWQRIGIGERDDVPVRTMRACWKAMRAG
jgi:hypothetical protein